MLQPCLVVERLRTRAGHGDVAHRNPDDAAVHLLDDVDRIGIDVGIVGARRAVDHPDHQRRQHRHDKD
ncbi:hypothetical protein DIE22_11610 [Burkholderia sp. Bp9142]|nr:hypothetical protein DIE22_11610 [Burkholderia sp. Bp9142]